MIVTIAMVLSIVFMTFILGAYLVSQGAFVFLSRMGKETAGSTLISTSRVHPNTKIGVDTRTLPSEGEPSNTNP